MPSPTRCPASGRTQDASSTNTSVADDMLPKLRSTSREKCNASGGSRVMLDRIEDGATAGVHRPQRDVVRGAIAQQFGGMVLQPTADAAGHLTGEMHSKP